MSGSVFGRPFELGRDTFAFSNDTFFSYGIDELGQLQIAPREKPVEYAHRCFVLSRAALQFHQFARFDAKQPRLGREAYRQLVRRICRIPVWSEGPMERLVVPGFSDLRGFSVAYEGLLKENLGNWLPTYFRVGNWRLVFPHPRAGQARLAAWLVESLAEGRLRALYLSRFPHMNHVVVSYRMDRLPGGDLRFWVYDPNYPGKPACLKYRAGSRTFEFERRWYFPGGAVNVMRVYISPFH